MSDSVSPIVPGRECNGCTLCCKLLRIEALNKPEGTWCEHCNVGVGCRIYEDRPGQCRTFYCGFLQRGNLSEEWRPSRCKIVLVAELGGNRIAAYVDPGRPGAWRVEPYYSRSSAGQLNAVPHKGQVVACDGNRTTVILPDEDVDLGVIAEDELIVTAEIRTPPRSEAASAKD